MNYLNLLISSNLNSLIFTLFYILQALRLRKTALGETTPGKVVNLIANDVNRFELVSFTIQYMWSAPLSALFIAYVLYSEVGYPGFIGIAVIFIVVPIQCKLFVTIIECQKIFYCFTTKRPVVARKIHVVARFQLTPVNSRRNTGCRLP